MLQVNEENETFSVRTKDLKDRNKGQEMHKTDMKRSRSCICVAVYCQVLPQSWVFQLAECQWSARLQCSHRAHHIHSQCTVK